MRAGLGKKTAELRVVMVDCLEPVEDVILLLAGQKADARVAFRQFLEFRHSGQATIAVVLAQNFGKACKFAIDREVSVALLPEVDRQFINECIVIVQVSSALVNLINL
ncbi:MAG: hypothetical protein GY789_22235 [Hyphomicrobiales bacterium]|nr:hypothetical protein [Hyphomicrobiales bacterium]